MFGTDGIRGYPNTDPLTAEGILRLAYSLAAFLKEKGWPSKAILIGRDTRKSGPMMESALIAGLTASGLDVVSGGILPTPAVSALVAHHNLSLGIVLSASHNPARYNGIKLFGPQGEKLTPEAEERISQIWRENPSTKVEPEEVGTLVNWGDTPQKIYQKLMGEKFPQLNLEGLKIVLDCANGALSALAPAIMRNFGAQVFPFFDSPDGHNINVDCGAMHPQRAAEMLNQQKAHIGFTFDGDGDRMMAVDEKGEVRDGDFILAVLASFYRAHKSLPGDTVVATSMSNLGLEKALDALGVRLVRTEVGDRHVYEEMKRGGYKMGGEQSGHIILTEYANSGDGLVTALELLRILQEEKKSLSQLVGDMKKYPQLIHNVEVPSKPSLEKIPALKEVVEEVEGELQGRGRLVLRYSGTEPLLRIMLEGETRELIHQLKDKLAQAIQRGFEQIS